jgi:hypothetical protein
MLQLLSWIRVAVLRAGWAPIVVFVLHVVISRGFGAYLAYPGLDQPMHGLGGVAIAHFFWVATGLDEAIPILGNLLRTGRLILSMALVGTATVVWELLEWTGDALGYTSAQVGLDDTMLDMLLGLAGGALYFGIRALRRA